MAHILQITVLTLLLGEISSENAIAVRHKFEQRIFRINNINVSFLPFYFHGDLSSEYTDNFFYIKPHRNSIKC